MIPAIYDKNEVYVGTLFDTIECLVTEERNGEFELTLTYPVNLFDVSNVAIIEVLKEQNIIIANANDTLLNQKFRIYNVLKTMSNRIRVLARHISFDLAYDIIEPLNIQGQKADYVANQIFLKSQFSQDYKAVTDIIMTADYSIDLSNCLEAIAGKEGSIIDTFGTGSELLRDNKNIAILTKRGFDKGVTIEYRKNMTGIDVEEDDTDLTTWIYPMAKYTNENEEEVTVTLMDKFVKSSRWEIYSHPYIRVMDFTDDFEEGEIPTEERLIALCNKYFQNSKCDIPKINYTIEFIPLSNCVGYEGLEDRISLCDVVTIIDDRYNINTKSKVIRTIYNVIRERYESMELGEPKTKLGDVIGNIAGSATVTTPSGTGGGKPTEPTYPNIVPVAPIVNARVYGFNSIEVTWTYEAKPYYDYELYASTTENFIPNEQDLIFKGKASTFLHIVNPNQKWFFKVCVINTYDVRSEFSIEVSAETKKIEDLSNYVEDMAIGNALIGELDLGRGWFGQLIGTYINAKMLQVVRGDGLLTLDIDSEGNVSLNVKKLEINSEQVYTADEVNMELDKIIIGTRNFIITNKLSNYAKWNDLLLENDQIILIPTNIEESRITLLIQDFIPQDEIYTLSGYATINDTPIPADFFTSGKANTDNTGESEIYVGEEGYFYITEAYNGTTPYILNSIVKANTMDRIVFTFLKFEKGTKATDWTPSPEDIQANIELIEQTLGTQINSEILASQKELLEKIAEEYPTAEDVQIEIQKATSSLIQTDKDINMNFETLDKIVVDLGDRYEIFEQVVSTNINFSQEGIILGKNDSPFKVKLDNQQLSFIENETVVAYINNNTMFINNAQIKEYLSIGNDELGYFSWVMRNNGNMTLKWVGGK